MLRGNEEVYRERDGKERGDGAEGVLDMGKSAFPDKVSSLGVGDNHQGTI